MNNQKIMVFMLCGLFSITAQAVLLGEYTFNDTGSGTTEQRMPAAMGATSVVSGAAFSQLGTNTSFELTFGGFANVIPNDEYDGFSFFGNSGTLYLGMRRADSGVSSAFARNDDTSAAVQPLNFTITADAVHSITVSNLVISSVGVTIYAFQEAGAVRGTTVITASALGDDTISLDVPVVIGAGTSKTFTIYMNSGAFSSAHWLNNIAVYGSVADSDAAVLGQYTFNDTGSGIQADRMPVAMGATEVTNGVTLSVLGTNTSFALTFGGFANAIPDDECDGFSFFGNSGNLYLGMRCADAGVASAFAQNEDTSTAVQPLHFTVTADETHDVTVNGIEISSVGVTIFAFQEAGASLGAYLVTTNVLSDDIISLTEPVSVRAGTSKTFTVYMNGGTFNSAHWLNNIAVLGDVTDADSTEPQPANIIGFSAFSEGIMKMVVNTTNDLNQSFPESTSDLVATWAAVAHSYDGAEPFVVTNLSYSAVEGSNVVIYVQSDTPNQFFRIQTQ